MYRIITVYKDLYEVSDGEKSFLSKISGNMLYNKNYPVVGDYVELKGEDIIIDIKDRKSLLKRVASGSDVDDQVMVANIDYVFIVSSMNNDFNLNRLERYLTMVYDSGAMPVFILSKADLAEDKEFYIDQLEEIAYGVDIHIVSSFDESSIKKIRKYLIDGNTITLVGSSGVGKSTIINNLLGYQKSLTKDIRDDDKGRHTTTTRQLYYIDNGAIIDTPGMRELKISSNLDKSFEDIIELAKKCKFNNCTHESEPDCAIKKAIENGDLSQKRFDNYQKLLKEITHYDNLAKGGHKFMEKEKIKNMMGSLDARKKIYNLK